jgi:hypothetical protein
MLYLLIAQDIEDLCNLSQILMVGIPVSRLGITCRLDSCCNRKAQTGN